MARKKKPKTPESMLKAAEKYRVEKTTQIYLKFNKEKDADIIKRLNTLQDTSKIEYIRTLIRKDIEENLESVSKTDEKPTN